MNKQIIIKSKENILNDNPEDNNTLSMENLIEKISLLSDNNNPYNVSKEIEEIKSLFYIKLNLERQEETANENTPKPESIEQKTHPLEKKFKTVFNAYRKIKADFRKNKEKEERENLKIKRKIITDIDLLAKEEESFKITFEKFRLLQEKWKKTGHVSITENNNLWQSYHHHIELFYDYIKINKDLRDLDFKRNLQEKTEICKKAELLLKEKSINGAHNTLQELHEHWKNVGPVEIKQRNPLWQRFQEISKKINKKRNDYFIQRKKQDSIKLHEKNLICIEIENLASKERDSHKKWQEATIKFNELEKKWKSLVGLNKKDNKVAWKSFKNSLNNFYNTKNTFYRNKKEEIRQIVKRKKILCKKAEELKNSNNWLLASKELIKLQKEWKKSDFVYSSEANQIWENFKTACNTFFERKKANDKQIKENEEKLYQKQKNLVKKIGSHKISSKPKEEIEKLNKIKKEWLEISRNSKNTRKLTDEFLNLLNSKFKEIGLNKKTLVSEQYKNKIDLIQGNSKAINSEKEYLKKKINTVKKEIDQYENNISFFNRGKATEKLLEQTQKKIQTAKSDIKNLEKKLQLLNY